jgi:hypothetical protein
MSEKRLCRDFMANPRINPLDGGRLIPGKGPYNGFVALCQANDFDVDYMLDDEFIEGLKSKSARSTSLPRSPRSPRSMRSPTSPSFSSSRSVLSSQPTLPKSAPLSLPPRSPISVTPISMPRSSPVPAPIISPVPVQPAKRMVCGSYSKPVTVPTIPSVSYPRVVSPSITRSSAPAPMVSQRTESVGRETFNPDPITEVTETPPTSVRRSVKGPYGSNGEDVIIPGIHTLPGTRTYTTTDFPEHEVRSINGSIVNSVGTMNSVGTGSTLTKRVRYPQPSYEVRSESIGKETFDPDPTTTVTDYPEQRSRITARGPYGRSGEDTIVNGTYKSQGRRVYSTSDIPEHEVVSSLSRSPMNMSSPRGSPMSVSSPRGSPMNISSPRGSPMSISYPQPSITERSEFVGDETFDPDEIEDVEEYPGQISRVTARGPYGNSGEDILINGTYRSPGTRVYTKRDYPEHSVTSSLRKSSVNISLYGNEYF